MTTDTPHTERVLRLVRFALNSGVLLGFKVGCMWLLDGAMDPRWAYVLVHLVLLGFSYALHSKITMRVATSWVSFGRYTRAVAVIKLTDYLVFSVAFSFFHVEALWSVVLATAVIWLARYSMVTRALAPTQADTSRDSQH